MTGPAAVLQHRRLRSGLLGLLVAGLICVLAAPALALALCPQTSPTRRTVRPTASAAGCLSMRRTDQPEYGPSSPSTAAASSLLAAALLLLPLQDASAATTPTPRTAAEIDIDLRSVPSLTRRAVQNRERLTGYLVDTAKSIKPILDLLSESDTVTVIPPADSKGAIERLVRGDAQAVVNGNPVDVRVESVPGSVIVRITSPALPRLPFLADGSRAMAIVDDMVDAAPAVTRGAGEVESFLTWGTDEPLLKYKGSALDVLLSGESFPGGPTVGQVGLAAGVAGVGAAYAGSYAYYTSERQKQDEAAREKAAANKRKAEERKKKAEEKKRKDQEAKKQEKAASQVEEEPIVEPEPPQEATTAASKQTEQQEQADGEAVAEDVKVVEDDRPAEEDDAAGASEDEDGVPERRRKRDALKRLFKR
ncbi:hypothetical protein THAOC_11351 [Thalassiosira oceanica]|uniref:Uncharacterized protein n=1 Tax=Thalassiosira oceanica TaxID=159749 RepID=K0SMR2_THAOC|nr:hypothetical protein THAOC_11351 [Thalassiosira oceanica]|eukprot:EJK67593.1 hypothetical protein THAOC_11351 [Thalassiosira oceanica]